MTPLDRPTALRWLSARGIDAEADASFRLVAEEAELPGVVVRRLWHSPAILHRRAADPRTALLLIPLEGSPAVSAGGGAARIVGAGTFAAVSGGAHAQVTTTGASARLEIVAAPGRRAAAAIAARGVLSAPSAALTTTIAAVNAILESRPRRDDPAAPGLAAALEGLVSAVLAGSLSE